MFELWRDERAFVVTAELTLLASVLVSGVLVGLASIRDLGVQELSDLAGAIESMNQSYSFSAITRSTAWTAGSVFIDQRDFCDEPTGDLKTPSGEAGVSFQGLPTFHEDAVRTEYPEA